MKAHTNDLYTQNKFICKFKLENNSSTLKVKFIPMKTFKIILVFCDFSLPKLDYFELHVA